MSTPIQLSENTIQLAGTATADRAKLQTYFTTILQAEKSGEAYPILLDHIWRVGYAAKEAAVKALRKNFLEDVDYQSLVQLEEREIGATRRHVYKLSVSCAEYFAVRANREVFDIYRQCRQAVQQLVATPQLPANYADALRQLAEKVENEQRLQQQLQLEMHKKEQARQEGQRLLQVATQAEESLQAAGQVIEAQAPAVELVRLLTDAGSALTLEEAAKTLGVKGIGRTNLMRKMVEENILLKSSKLPASRYQQHFPVKQSIFVGEDGRTFSKSQVLVAAKGMLLLKRLFA